MEVRKIVTYEHVKLPEADSQKWFQQCAREGNPVTEIEGWRSSKGLVIISLGNDQWLVPVLDHSANERYDT